MAYSFDSLVYFSTLLMFVAALVSIFVYEYFAAKSVPAIPKESTISANLNKKGSRYKQNKQKTGKFG
ncbi:MAG: hypothetical protein M3M88_03145 [Thermoproteota archaeon]|nr:hypothetical protein [Thermoproteota archaeon]